MLAVLYNDAHLYPRRAEQIERITRTCGASCWTLTHDDPIPADWLPDKPQPAADWLRAGYRSIHYIQRHRIRATHYLHIEGDVHGDDAAWQRLISISLSPADLISPFARADRCFGGLMAFSARAIHWLAAAAARTRHLLHEISIPESIAAHHGIIRDLRAAAPRLISRRTLLYSGPSLPHRHPLMRPAMLSHPVKSHF